MGDEDLFITKSRDVPHLRAALFEIMECELDEGAPEATLGYIQDVARKALGGDDRIFGGLYSTKMWDRVDEADTVNDLAAALHLVCCRLQEFECKVMLALEAKQE